MPVTETLALTHNFVTYRHVSLSIAATRAHMRVIFSNNRNARNTPITAAVLCALNSLGGVSRGFLHTAVGLGAFVYLSARLRASREGGWLAFADTDVTLMGYMPLDYV